MLLFPSLNKYKARTCTCSAGASAPGSPYAGPAMPAVVPGLKAVSLPCCWCCWAGVAGGGSHWSDGKGHRWWGSTMGYFWTSSLWEEGGITEISVRKMLLSFPQACCWESQIKNYPCYLNSALAGKSCREGWSWMPLLHSTFFSDSTSRVAGST